MLAVAIVAARFLQFAALSVLFGSSLFYLYGFKVGSTGVSSRRWAWPNLLLLVAAVVGVVATLAWLMAETAILTDSAANAFNPASLWFLLSETGFGGVYLFRLGLLAFAIAAYFALPPGRELWIAESILGGVVVASFARTGHGIYDKGVAGMVHSGGDALHALAAAAWIGALVPLSMLILRARRSGSPADASASYFGLERFSGIGLAVVSVLVLTGGINSWFLIGIAHWRELFTTPYGQTLLLKLVLFGAMLVLAAANRFLLVPQLSMAVGMHSDDANALSLGHSIRALQVSILTETVLATLVLAVVAYLGSLEPPVSG